jgi:aspartate aminotransferase
MAENRQPDFIPSLKRANGSPFLFRPYLPVTLAQFLGKFQSIYRVPWYNARGGACTVLFESGFRINILKGWMPMIDLSKKAKHIEASPTMAVDAKAKRLKAQGVDIVGFGAGEPDFDTPKHVREEAKKAIDNGFTRYTPAEGMVELRSLICEKLKADNGLSYAPEDIVVSNGAKHALANAFSAILNPGDEVLVPAPYWVSYPYMIQMADGVPVILNTTEEEHFKATAASLKKAITQRTKAIVVNSPGNPTGMVYTKEELMDIARLAEERDLVVVSDEIYEELVYDGTKHISIASLGEGIKNRTIVVNGFSKAYAMTGWRMGYTACATHLAKAMANIQSHATSNPNSIAQKAAMAALTGGKACIMEMRVEFEKRRNYMVERIGQMKYVTCIKPQGAFYVWMNVSALFGKSYKGQSIRNVAEFCECLLEKAHVAVVPGKGFGVETYARLSYATSLDIIKKGLDRMETFLNDCE